ncbi:MAG: radical SAM protein [bacterium]|nr:radical SAM protein [bacterium]
MPSSVPELGLLDDAWILARRGPRNAVSPERPYAHLVETERAADGRIVRTLTVLITNRECPFRCLMCDLWKNTTTSPVPEGAVADQIEWVLETLAESNATPGAPAEVLKLYNAGSFFDSAAIPRADWARIAELSAPFETVIVESHPRMIDRRCLELADALDGKLQVAMGLETVDPEVLPRLNKRMTVDDFERATRFLLDHGIEVRAFILIRAPFQSESQGVEWAKRSIDAAFSMGVECCVVIPTRAGNGAMERLAELGHYAPPSMQSIEAVLDYGVGLASGRVFVDLWDIEKFSDCPECALARRERLNRTNLTQQPQDSVNCRCRS